MGHVILKEFFVERQTYFTDYTKKYASLPYLVVLDETTAEGDYRPGSSSPPRTSRPTSTRERPLQDRP